MRKNRFKIFMGVCIILFAGLWITSGIAEARSKGKMRWKKHHMADHHKSIAVSQWIKQFGTADDESAVGIAVDSAGNSYVTGYTYGDLDGTNIGVEDIFIAKYDTSGNQIWIKQFGSADGDIAIGIAVDSVGNSYITGYTYGDLAGTNVGKRDIFIAKYGTSGNQVWIKQFGSADADFGYGITVDSAGNSYVTGSTSWDIFIAKYDTSGNQIWIKQFGSANPDFGYGIAVDSAGNSYVTGFTAGDLSGTGNARRKDAFVIKHDTFGNQIWVVQFGSAADDEGYGIAVDSAGNSYITGYTDGNLAGTNIGYSDIFIAKYDTLGNQIWIKQFGSATDDFGYGIAMDSADNSYVTGYTSGDLAGTSLGKNDIFIAKYNTDGTLWVKQFGSTDDDEGYGIAVDSAGNNYVTGTTSGDLAGTNIGYSDIFIAKNYESSPQSSGVTYSLGGTVNGLTEAIELEFNVKYQDPDGSRILVNGLTALEENGPFVLGEFEDGSIYGGVEIVNPLASCSITNDSGIINGADVTGILVECFDVPFFTDIAAGTSHTVALKLDGTVWAWGSNGRGELGDGTTTNRATPVQVIGLTGVTAIAAGGYHTVALKSDGTVWAWGLNSSGQLGATTEDICRTATDEPCSSTPVQVIGLTEVTAIAAGSSHTVTLKSDGTVWAWGPNRFGQLGAETTETCTDPWGGSYLCSSTPVQVNGLTDVTTIAAGYSYTVALRLDGTVWAWGLNSSGQLGAETTETCTSPLGSSYPCSSTPVQVNGIANVTAIAAGDAHTAALKTDSTVWEWPWESSLSGPVQVSGLTEVIGIAEGGQHSIALKSNGTVWMWGYNINDPIGDGTRRISSVPVQVSDLVDITAITAGYWFSIALKSDDTIWGWGDNYSGQLGDGTTGGYSTTPVQTLWQP